jgi:predicted ester cyclase
MTADNKSLVQKFQRDIDTGRNAILDTYIGSSYADHNPPPFASKAPGMRGLKETFDLGLAMFSDFKHVIDDQVSEGDKVATRITGSGRHVGPFLGVPATNKVVTMSGIAIHRVADGRLVEHWGQVDALGLLTQLGAVPAPPAPPTPPTPVSRGVSSRPLGAEEMKGAIRRLFSEVMNGRNWPALSELLDPGYVNYTFPGPTPGPHGFRQAVEMFISAFPDMHIEVEDVIAEPDKAVSRGHFTGTHRGAFMNVPPTGKSVSVSYIDMWRAYDGRLVENWVQLDLLGALIQLGAIPAPAV